MQLPKRGQQRLLRVDRSSPKRSNSVKGRKTEPFPPGGGGKKTGDEEPEKKINYDEKKMQATYVRFPQRSELNAEINESLIVEYYSRV